MPHHVHGIGAQFVFEETHLVQAGDLRACGSVHARWPAAVTTPGLTAQSRFEPQRTAPEARVGATPPTPL